MTQFVQPQNREADLHAILEGYEGRIETEYWLSDALQKDGIQNSWDARVSKKGIGWHCSIFYKNDTSKNKTVIGIVDMGTTGLTGCIPQNQEDAVRILVSEDPNEKLAYFLSSNWSKKAQDALGSRGRGKMIFIGASEERTMYFDSRRSTDNKYVFGKTYLDKNKAISVEVYEGVEAEEKRKEIFGDMFETLTEYGTRVIIPDPKKSVIDAFLDNFLEEQIQSTWWEILQKYNADIELDVGGIKNKVEPSLWMPVNKLGIKETDSFEIINIPKYDDLKIKRISFCYLGDKEIPEAYKGLAIQRSGMVVERHSISKLIGNSIGDKIIGSVELEEELEKVMRDNEGPEHYNIFWTRSIPQSFKTALKSKAIIFAKKFKLLEEEKREENTHQHQAEIAVQKKLNDLAKTLGFTIGNQIGGQIRKKHSRKPDEKICLSMDDFTTPYDNGRVNTGQSITGAYAVPSSAYRDTLKVNIRTWVFHNDQILKNEGRDMMMERQIELPLNGIIKIGWDELKIDDKFENGKYSLRSKIRAAEDKILDSEYEVEKGKEIYSTSRTFYVNEDPKDKGIFKFQAAPKPGEKTKYYWWSWSPEDNQYVIYYNTNHPIFESIKNDPTLIENELMKIGPLAVYSIVISIDQQNMDEGRPLKVFKENQIKDCTFDEIMQVIVEKQSEFLWNKNI